MSNKQCSKCKLNKSFDCFNKSASGRFGLHNHCKDCQKEVRRQWYLNNLDEEKSKSKEYSKSKKGKEDRKRRYEKNKETILEKNRIRRRTPHARQMANKARNKIYNENPSFRMSVNLRCRIRDALKGKNKSKSTMELLGCSFEELKVHLESKFSEGMTWENYKYDGWHIDHIIPCASFDLSKEEDVKKCFHWTNLQPLWRKDNISKGCKILQK